jgi:hypothetical protein
MSILCVDIGGTRIKYTELPPNSKLDDIKNVRPYTLRSLGWLNGNFPQLFSKDHWAGIFSNKNNFKAKEIAVCVPGPVSNGKYFMRHDLIGRGMPKNLKETIERFSNLHVTGLIKDADAWAIGVEKYLKATHTEVDYPILSLTFGTGVGVSIIKSPSEYHSIEISSAPCEFHHLSDKSGSNVEVSWKVHHRIGAQFFDWVAGERTEWSYDHIRKEFSKRINAFILDLVKLLPKELRGFKTIILTGGNSEYVSVRSLKESSGKKVITFWSRKLDVNPDVIPLLGLSHFNSNITINKSPWNN